MSGSERVLVVRCPECNYVNHIGRFDMEECYSCARDLLDVVRPTSRSSLGTSASRD